MTMNVLTAVFLLLLLLLLHYYYYYYLCVSIDPTFSR